MNLCRGHKLRIELILWYFYIGFLKKSEKKKQKYNGMEKMEHKNRESIIPTI